MQFCASVYHVRPRATAGRSTKGRRHHDSYSRHPGDIVVNPLLARGFFSLVGEGRGANAIRRPNNPSSMNPLSMSGPRSNRY